MTIYIHLKQIKKRSSQITACPYTLAEAPDTLRSLIVQLVTDGVQGYRRRREQEDCAALSPEQIEDLAQIGKIGFSVPFGSGDVALSDAVETAVQGFADGLYRVFIGDREAEELDAPLDLTEGDTVTIIRLVMLTGGYF